MWGYLHGNFRVMGPWGGDRCTRFLLELSRTPVHGSYFDENKSLKA